MCGQLSRAICNIITASTIDIKYFYSKCQMYYTLNHKKEPQGPLKDFVLWPRQLLRLPQGQQD